MRKLHILMAAAIATASFAAMAISPSIVEANPQFSYSTEGSGRSRTYRVDAAIPGNYGVQVSELYAKKRIFDPITTSPRSMEWYYPRLSSRQQQFYDAIFSRLKKGYLVVPYRDLGIPAKINYSSRTVTIVGYDAEEINNDLGVAMTAIRNDHPELAYFPWEPSYTYRVEYTLNGIVPDVLDYDIPTLKNKMRSAQAWLDAAARAVKEKRVYSEFDRMEYIGTLIETNFQYDETDGPMCRSLLAAGEKDKKIVCCAYAYLTAYLAKQAGVQAVYAVNSTHMWNYVYVDSEWHVFDCTYGYRGKDAGYASWKSDQDSADNQLDMGHLFADQLPQAVSSTPPYWTSSGQVITRDIIVGVKRPKPVKGVKAYISDDQTILTWELRPKASGYRIYISKDNGATWNIVTTIYDKNILGFAVNRKSKNHIYKVRAFKTSSDVTVWGRCSAKVKGKKIQ